MSLPSGEELISPMSTYQVPDDICIFGFFSEVNVHGEYPAMCFPRKIGSHSAAGIRRVYLMTENLSVCYSLTRKPIQHPRNAHQLSLIRANW